MKKIVILHFSPLELYPPIQNLIRQLESKDLARAQIHVFSTASSNSLLIFKSNRSEIKIKRFGKSGRNLLALIRYWNYMYFYLTSLIHLIINRPQSVLYFETISSFPVYIYKKFFYSSCKIFIHYHEYTSILEYEKGMLLVKYFHKLEKEMYPSAKWVSHTNVYRMEFFKKDIYPIVLQNDFILPNYPPCSWQQLSKKELRYPLKIVNAGAFGFDTMYVKEFAQWVVVQQGRVVWDVYSNNYDTKAQEYIDAIASPWINLKQGVSYDELPPLLTQYDIGVILYKGHIPNYVYNVPNKLFEYLACGLDVWFPNVMIGSLPYQDAEHYPRVIALDFTKLNTLSLEELLKRPTQQKTDSYYCEQALEPLISILVSNNQV